MPPGSRWTSARLLKLSLSEYSSMDVKHLEANLLACLRGMAVSQLAGQLCSKAHVWKGGGGCGSKSVSICGSA